LIWCPTSVYQADQEFFDRDELVAFGEIITMTWFILRGEATYEAYSLMTLHIKYEATHEA